MPQWAMLCAAWSKILEQKSVHNMELLAPAGSIAQLKAATSFGANAVYLGLSGFSARAKAEDFTIDNLAMWVSYAHRRGVRVYLALNILIKEPEMKSALELSRRAFECGVDALIIQDIGLLNLIRQELKERAVLHLSTQGGVVNALGAMSSKKLGVSRVILSREATLADIKDIVSKVDIEVEYFVHGALCVAFSGNCYFSSLVSGYSGNRGRCMQLCRKMYSINHLKGGQQGYYLSTKDTCLVEHLDTLRQAGVCSIKIEGRLRRHEYVGEVVRVYRKALDGQKVTYEDIELLKAVYNRGNFSSGYLFGSPHDLIYPSVNGHLGVFAGTILECDGDLATIGSNRSLSEGDCFKVLRDGREVCGACLIAGGKARLSKKAKKGDQLWVTLDSAQMKRINDFIAFKCEDDEN